MRHDQGHVFELGHMLPNPVVNLLVQHQSHSHSTTCNYCSSCLLYMEFFASRNADMTSMRSVLPVNFWISGSYNSTVSSTSFLLSRTSLLTSSLIKTLCFYRVGSACVAKHRRLDGNVPSHHQW